MDSMHLRRSITHKHCNYRYFREYLYKILLCLHLQRMENESKRAEQGEEEEEWNEKLVDRRRSRYLCMSVCIMQYYNTFTKAVFSTQKKTIARQIVNRKEHVKNYAFHCTMSNIVHCKSAWCHRRHFSSKHIRLHWQWEQSRDRDRERTWTAKESHDDIYSVHCTH